MNSKLFILLFSSLFASPGEAVKSNVRKEKNELEYLYKKIDLLSEEIRVVSDSAQKSIDRAQKSIDSAQKSMDLLSEQVRVLSYRDEKSSRRLSTLDDDISVMIKSQLGKQKPPKELLQEVATLKSDGHSKHLGSKHDERQLGTLASGDWCYFGDIYAETYVTSNPAYMRLAYASNKVSCFNCPDGVNRSNRNSDFDTWYHISGSTVQYFFVDFYEKCK